MYKSICKTSFLKIKELITLSAVILIFQLKFTASLKETSLTFTITKPYPQDQLVGVVSSDTSISYRLSTPSTIFNLQNDSSLGWALKTSKQLTLADFASSSVRLLIMSLPAPPKELIYLEIIFSNSSFNDNNNGQNITLKFDKDSYKTEISEIAHLREFVFQVKAISTSSQDITYKLIDNYEKQFMIEASTGIIRVAKTPLSCGSLCLLNEIPSPQIEECPAHTCLIPVEASITTPRTFTTRTYISIYIIDHNNHHPHLHFSNSIISNKGVTILASTNTPNNIVSVISVMDNDRGDNGKAKVELYDGNQEGFFSLENTSISIMYLLRLVKNIELSTLSSNFHLTFKTTDFGTPPLINLTSVTIRFNFSNSLHLQFEQKGYQSIVLDVLPAGSFVSAVKAFFVASDQLNKLSNAQDNNEDFADKDQSTLKIMYKIEKNNDKAYFEINSQTGLITTAKDFKNVKFSDIVINVTAMSESDTKSYTANTLVKIHMNKTIPTCPSFPFETYYITYRTAEANMVLMTLNSRTREGEYFLDDVTLLKYSKLFFIDKISGLLSLSRQLIKDEDEDLYELHVSSYLKDDYFKPFSNFCGVAQTKIVLTVVYNLANDLFKCYPTKYYINLNGNEKLNDDLVRVNFNKYLKNYDYEIVYKITSISYVYDDVASSDRFKLFIDPNTGWIKLNSSLSDINFVNNDIKNRNKFILKVEVNNKNGEKCEIDVDIHLPNYSSFFEFTSKSYEFSVTESSTKFFFGSPRPIGQLKITDKNNIDSGVETKFEIIDGDMENIFTINPSTGWLLQNSHLDRESTPIKNLSVAVIFTQAGVNTTSLCNVLVRVMDLNDNHPQLVVSHQKYFEISVSSVVQHLLFRIHAYDLDLQENSTLRFHLIDTIPSENDRNRLISSFIKEHMKVDKNTGEITLMKEINVSAIESLVEDFGNSFDLMVVATDQGSFPLSSTFTFKFSFKRSYRLPETFTDKRFYHEVFDVYYKNRLVVPQMFPLSNQIVIVIPESLQVNTIFHCFNHHINIANLTNNILYRQNYNDYLFIYAILHGNQDQAIKIFPDGCLYVGVPLDRETTDTYILQIGTRSIQNCDLHFQIYPLVHAIIYIDDVNDNRPKFEKSIYQFEVSEKAPRGTLVGQVVGTDADFIDNYNLIYSLSSNNFFQIHSTSGKIYTKNIINKDSRSGLIALRVKVKDSDDFEDEVYVEIVIVEKLKLNFAKDFYFAFVSELHDVTKPILTLHAAYNSINVSRQNKEETKHNALYTVSSSKSARLDQYFHLNATSGDLKLIGEVKNIPQKIYEFTVTSSTNTDSAMVAVFIVVNKTTSHEGKTFLSNGTCVYEQKYNEFQHINQNEVHELLIPEIVGFNRNPCVSNLSAENKQTRQYLKVIFANDVVKKDKKIFKICASLPLFTANNDMKLYDCYNTRQENFEYRLISNSQHSNNFTVDKYTGDVVANGTIGKAEDFDNQNNKIIKNWYTLLVEVCFKSSDNSLKWCSTSVLDVVLVTIDIDPLVISTVTDVCDVSLKVFDFNGGKSN